MVKNEFINFLKDISEKLTENEIKHDIPYCHIDKIDFNHIYIIIPDFIMFDELSALNPNFVKEKHGVIYTKIKDFCVNFVKTSEDLWGYTFHFYNWNTMNIYIQCLCDFFNLVYTRTGLKYKYKDKEIFISKNLKDIIEFLGLSFRFFGLGFPSELVINTYIESSPYYDTNNFTKEKFIQYDTMYEYNKKYYKNFIKYKNECNAEKMNEEDKIVLIDTMFQDSDFLKKLYKYQLQDSLPEGVTYKSKEQVVIDENKIPEKPQKKKISMKKFFDKKDDNGEYKLED